MGSSVQQPPGILRRATTAVVALAIAIGGIAYVVRGTTANDTILYKWERPLKGGREAASGATVGYVTTSGSLAMSGTIRAQGGFAAMTITTSDSNQVANTTTETNFNQNYVIPANSVKAGDTFRVYAAGSGASAGGGIRMKLKLGSTSIAFIGLTMANTKNYWAMDGTLIFRTVGASAAVETSTRWHDANATANWDSITTVEAATGATIDTTTAQTLQLSAEPTAASVAEYTTMTQFIVEKLRQ